MQHFITRFHFADHGILPDIFVARQAAQNDGGQHRRGGPVPAQDGLVFGTQPDDKILRERMEVEDFGAQLVEILVTAERAVVKVKHRFRIDTPAGRKDTVTAVILCYDGQTGIGMLIEQLVNEIVRRVGEVVGRGLDMRIGIVGPQKKVRAEEAVFRLLVKGISEGIETDAAQPRAEIHVGVWPPDKRSRPQVAFKPESQVICRRKAGPVLCRSGCNAGDIGRDILPILALFSGKRIAEKHDIQAAAQAEGRSRDDDGNGQKPFFGSQEAAHVEVAVFRVNKGAAVTVVALIGVSTLRSMQQCREDRQDANYFSHGFMILFWFQSRLN